jgi:hypothetical protein
MTWAAKITFMAHRVTGHVGVSQLEQPTDHDVCFLFVYILNVFPLSNNRKLAVQMLRLELHITFQEQLTGAI